MSLRIAACLAVFLGAATASADAPRRADTARATYAHQGDVKVRSTKNPEAVRTRVAPREERGALERKTTTAPWHDRIVRITTREKGDTPLAERARLADVK